MPVRQRQPEPMHTEMLHLQQAADVRRVAEAEIGRPAAHFFQDTRLHAFAQLNGDAWITLRKPAYRARQDAGQASLDWR